MSIDAGEYPQNKVVDHNLIIIGATWFKSMNMIYFIKRLNIPSLAKNIYLKPQM